MEEDYGMRSIKLSSLGAVGVLAALCVTSLQASPLAGTFNIAGTMTVTVNTINWKANETPFSPDLARIGPGSTGSFAGLDGSTITISDLSSATAPVGTPFPDVPFITFSAAPLFPALDINYIYKGIYSNANCGTLPATVAQNCTINPPNSPFNFVNNPPPAPTGPQATATFVFTGETADHLSFFYANFTSQFNVPFQTVLQAFGPGGSGQVTNTYSATVTVVPLPEPGALTLTGCGMGFVLISLAIRRRRTADRYM